MYEELNKLIDSIERASESLEGEEADALYNSVREYCERRFDKLDPDQQLQIETRLESANHLIGVRND